MQARKWNFEKSLKMLKNDIFWSKNVIFLAFSASFKISVSTLHSPTYESYIIGLIKILEMQIIVAIMKISYVYNFI